MKNMHERHAQQLGRWPVSDGAGIVDLVEKLCTVVARVTSETPELNVHVEYEDRTSTESKLDVLRSTAATIDITSARLLSVSAAVRTDSEWLIVYVMGLRIGRLIRSTSVSVKGTDEVHVDGLIANLESTLIRRGSDTTMRRTRWRRWRDNQWTVVIVGSASATVIGGLLLALLT